MSPSSQPVTAYLPDLKGILRYCYVEDITPLLQMIRSTITSDQSSFSAWDDDQKALIDSIQCADGPELKLIHEELNRIEMDRFLLTYSVTTLHQSCTHYRDVLSVRE